MGIESEAAEEMVSAVGNGVERVMPMAEQLTKEAISEAFKTTQKPSVRQALSDIKRSRQNKPDLGKTIEKAVKKIGGAR